MHNGISDMYNAIDDMRGAIDDMRRAIESIVNDSRKKGWKEGWGEGWEEGWEEGRKEGRTLMILIKKKLAKGKSIQTIAEELEEEQEVIENLLPY